MNPPRMVLGTAAELAAAAERLRLDGWRVHRGFALPDEPWELAGSRLVLAGELASEADARAALLGRVRGAGLAVRLDPGRPWAATFLADLARVDGPAPLPAPAADPLTAEQRQILDLLAAGTSIAQAARRLYLSLRTANRRVAAARAALGVSSTREAVLAYVRLRAGAPRPDPGTGPPP